jgi:hypothetical protein
MTIVHRTYTEFDLRAVTITGLSAKPTPGINAIGRFGTGLKYAIAVLLRNGCSVTIVTPGERHRMMVEAGDFRGTEYESVVMRTNRNDPTDKRAGKAKKTLLPFTTHYGINWEMWMAFRELHSNTLDEGGWTKLFNRDLPDEHKFVSEGCAIIVEGEAYETEYYNSGKTFLSLSYEPRIEVGGVKIYNLPYDDYANEFKYYRGLRAGEMQGNLCSLFIYDAIGEVYLTEERQIHDYYWDWRVCSAIAECDDRELIKTVLEAEDDTWESTLNFHPSMPASATFMEVAATAEVRNRHVEYIRSKRPESIKELSTDKYPTPWKMTDYAILSATDAVLATRPSDMTVPVFRGIWLDRIAAINTHAPTVFHPTDAPGADEPTEAPAEADEGDAERVFLTEPVEVEPMIDRNVDVQWDGGGSPRSVEVTETPVYAEGAELLDEVRKDFESAEVEPVYHHTEDNCPNHVASAGDAKVCGRCGTHINSLRPDPEDDMPF